MANSNSNVVTTVGILAIVILVGLAVYFVMRGGGEDSDFEVDVNGSNLDVPTEITARSAAASGPEVHFEQPAFIGTDQENVRL